MISIVIVNWNAGPLLANCCRSLAGACPDCEIIIVDNASDDSSLSFAQGAGEDLRIIRNTRNLGFAAACNAGWRASSGDRILFLNPDIECFPGSVERLQEVFTAESGIWAAAGQLISPSGEHQAEFNVRAFPTLPAVAVDMFFLDEIWPGNPWTRGDHAIGNAQPADVEQPAAACLMVSRTALESLGGFDEAFYPAWFEDVDLCRRIHDAGGRIRYQPEARFLHHGGYSLERMSREDFLESFHSNQIRYFLKHHGNRAAQRVKRLILAGLLIRCAVSLVYPVAPKQSRNRSAKTHWNAARRLAKNSGIRV